MYAPPPRQRTHVPPSVANDPLANGPDTDRRSTLYGLHQGPVAARASPTKSVTTETEKERQKVLLSCLPSNDDPGLYTSTSLPTRPITTSVPASSTNRGSKIWLSETGERARKGRLGGWVPNEVFGKGIDNHRDEAEGSVAGPAESTAGGDEPSAAAAPSRKKRSRNIGVAGVGGAGTSGKRRKTTNDGSGAGTSGNAPYEFDLSSSDSDSDGESSGFGDHPSPPFPHDPALLPSLPILPPTPLDPPSLIASPTLSHLFSRTNRTFSQISASATSLIEADLEVVRVVKEVGEVLRGDVGGSQGGRGRKWVEKAVEELERLENRAEGAQVDEEASEGRKSGGPEEAEGLAEAVTNGDVETGEEAQPPAEEQVTVEGADELGAVKLEAHDMDIDEAAADQAEPASTAAVGDIGDPEDALGGAVSASSRVSPAPSSRTGTGTVMDDANDGTSVRPRRSLRGAATNSRTKTADEGGKDGDDAGRGSAVDGGRSSLLEPALRVFTDPLPWVTSLFVEEDTEIKLPVHQYAAVAAHSGTAMGPDGFPLDPEAHHESLTPEQQRGSFNACAFEVSRFLADLEDYRERLTEVRDGCYAVDRRRRGMWGLVKLAAQGYEETANTKQRGAGSSNAGNYGGPNGGGVGAGPLGNGYYDDPHFVQTSILGVGGPLPAASGSSRAVSGAGPRASGRGRGRGRGAHHVAAD